jgi:hypothetical protein
MAILVYFMAILVYFMAILVYFMAILVYFCTEKNLAALQHSLFSFFVTKNKMAVHSSAVARCARSKLLIFQIFFSLLLILYCERDTCM